MEDHEILRRLRGGLFSEDAAVYASDVLKERGVAPDHQDIHTEAPVAPSMAWPTIFGLTAGMLAGAPVGALIGGAIGAAVVSASTIAALIAASRRPVAWVYGRIHSSYARFLVLLGAWLCVAWLCAVLGFASRAAAR